MSYFLVFVFSLYKNTMTSVKHIPLELSSFLSSPCTQLIFVMQTNFVGHVHFGCSLDCEEEP